MEVAQDSNASFSLKSTNAALLAAAEGEWEKAMGLLKGLVEKDEDNFVVRMLFLFFYHYYWN